MFRTVPNRPSVEELIQSGGGQVIVSARKTDALSCQLCSLPGVALSWKGEVKGLEEV